MNNSGKAIKIVALILAIVIFSGLVLGILYLITPNASVGNTNTENLGGNEETPGGDTISGAVYDENGNALDDNKVHVMPKAINFTYLALASSSNNVSIQIEAQVTPETAINKKVDYSIAWGTAPEHGSEPVTNFLSVVPLSDGNTVARITCLKAFGSDKIIITVKTRDGGYTDTCTVAFIGKASGITITSSEASAVNSAERGKYYSLGTNKTYKFNIKLSNEFNAVGKSDLTISVGAVGSLYFGDGYSDPETGYYRIINVKSLGLSTLANKFIKIATLSGDTITITTGNKIVEKYVDSGNTYTDDMGYTYTRNCYLYRDDDNMVGPLYTTDNDKCTENERNIKSCYFTVTVKDKVSGVSETIRLWLDGVSGVQFNKDIIEF